MSVCVFLCILHDACSPLLPLLVVLFPLITQSVHSDIKSLGGVPHHVTDEMHHVSEQNVMHFVSFKFDADSGIVNFLYIRCDPAELSINYETYTE